MKKIVIIVVLVLFFSAKSKAQLDASQLTRVNNVANTTEMNNLTPNEGCVVYVDSENTIYVYDGTQWVNAFSSDSDGWKMTGNISNQVELVGTTNFEDLRIHTNGSERMIVKVSGDVGINVTIPATRLFHVGSSPNEFVVTSGGIILDYSDDFIIGPYGKVGIGMFPNSYQLTVNGNILANAYNTPDYVFENYYSAKKSKLKTDYEFMPIEKVEAFVKVHHHLPGVPSQKDIENQGGILLNKSTEINLEKIEELFLHFFELNKKIESLKEEIEYLELHSQSKP